MNRKVQLAAAMLGAGEVSRRSCWHGVKATHGCDTLQEALVAPDGTGVEAIEVLWLKTVPAMSGSRGKSLKTPRCISTLRGFA
jgi:hypothetical protein